MARKIHKLISNGKTVVALVQTASSGGSKWGNPALLQTVRLDWDDLEQLTATRIANNPKVQQMESQTADCRNTGPRSDFGKRLAAMIKTMNRHLGANVVMQLDDLAHLTIPDALAQIRAALPATILEANTPQAPAPVQARRI